jgi:hypothetical protein
MHDGCHPPGLSFRSSAASHTAVAHTADIPARLLVQKLMRDGGPVWPHCWRPRDCRQPRGCQQRSPVGGDVRNQTRRSTRGWRRKQENRASPRRLSISSRGILASRCPSCLRGIAGRRSSIARPCLPPRCRAGHPLGTLWPDVARGRDCCTDPVRHSDGLATGRPCPPGDKR